MEIPIKNCEQFKAETGRYQKLKQSGMGSLLVGPHATDKLIVQYVLVQIQSTIHAFLTKYVLMSRILKKCEL